MKRLGTSTVLALVCVLGIVSSVQASTVTITLEVGSATLNVGEETDFTVWATVTGNPALGGFLPGLGLEGASLNLIQSNANVEIVEGFAPFPPPGGPTGKPAASLNKAQFAGLANPPSYRNAANRRGLDNFFVSNAFTKGTDDLDPISYEPAAFLLLGNTDVGGDPVWLVKGKIKGVTPGPVELNTEIQDLLYVYKDDGTGLALTQGPADENIFVPTIVTVLSDGDLVPTAGVGGPYGEEDWPMTPPGWNTPAREITVTGTGTDDIGVKSYQWLIAEPTSDTFAPLGDAVMVGPATEVDASTAISIQAIADALYGGDVGALPGPYGTGDPEPSVYNYKLKLLVTDTIDQTGEAETTLFVPEPGTLVLLGLGGLGALLRRRRRS